MCYFKNVVCWVEVGVYSGYSGCIVYIVIGGGTELEEFAL